MPDLAEHIGLFVGISSTCVVAVALLFWARLSRLDARFESRAAATDLRIDNLDNRVTQFEVDTEKGFAAMKTNYTDRFKDLTSQLTMTEKNILLAIGQITTKMAEEYLRKEDLRIATLRESEFKEVMEHVKNIEDKKQL